MQRPKFSFFLEILTFATPLQCHGLLGFDQLRLAGNYLPGIAYWRGITEALAANNVKVITTAGMCLRLTRL